MVPKDEEHYPTLGPQVCDFIERNMVFGPGDLRGQPVVLDDLWRALIYRMYEVFPQGHRLAGRRRFKRIGLSLRKGLAKTERAAMIAICELHPEAPVRCTGWTKGGEPIGGPVTDPYIPLVAYTEEQSDELAFTAMRVILENSPLKDDFDVGLERILRKKGDGKAVALSANPNARDGARTTFCLVDESHRMVLPRQLQAHTVMLTNIPKRKMADGWMLEVTTAFEPGAGSVAEATMEYAKAVDDGKVSDASLFYFHQQASDGHDLTTAEGRRAAILEAAGPAASWTDVDGMEALWTAPNADVAYLERVYTNRLVKSTTQAFNVPSWQALAKLHVVKPGALIVIGFDGAQFHDSTGIVCTEVESGYQWPAGLWECPLHGKGPDGEPWHVPAEEVDTVVRDLFATYTVWRMYADPPYWQSWVSLWIGLFGKERVIEWWTNRYRQMASALENFTTAIREEKISHAGSKDVERHIGNSRKKEIPQRDDQGKRLWIIQKERPDSPHKIDLAMASVLSWEARTDAIAAGALAEPDFAMFFIGGRK